MPAVFPGVALVDSSWTL